jgi:hypothetical protein
LTSMMLVPYKAVMFHNCARSEAPVSSGAGAQIVRHTRKGSILFG